MYRSIVWWKWINKLKFEFVVTFDLGLWRRVLNKNVCFGSGLSHSQNSEVWDWRLCWSTTKYQSQEWVYFHPSFTDSNSNTPSKTLMEAQNQKTSTTGLCFFTELGFWPLCCCYVYPFIFCLCFQNGKLWIMLMNKVFGYFISNYLC